MPIMR